jgi:hypothetical protein
MSQQQSYGNYQYQGCYNDTSTRAVPNQQQNVTSVDQCGQIAENLGASVFSVQDKQQCFTGNSLSQAQEYGKYTGSSSNCGTLGGTWTNQVYSLPPTPPTPTLSSINFADEPFINYNLKQTYSNIILFLIMLLVFIIFIYFISRKG